MPSVLNVDTIADAAGTGPVALTKQSAAKHWVNMDAGTTINDSFNTASITDNGTGDHASTMTNAMVNSDYVVSGSNISSPTNVSGEFFIDARRTHTTTTYSFKTRHNSGTFYDNDRNGLHLSGDLA